MASWQVSLVSASTPTLHWSTPTTSREQGAFGAAQTATTPTTSREHAKAFGVASASVVASNSIDGTDCAGSENDKKLPLQDGDNSPDSSADLDDDDGGLDDLSEDTSTLNYQDFSHFSVTDLDAIVVRARGITPVFPVPVHRFYCLHKHMRERAPPSAVPACHVVASAKMEAPRRRMVKADPILA